MLQRLENMLIPISEETLGLDELLASPYPYEQSMVKVIKNGGSFDLFSVSDYVQVFETKPVKIEGMERRNAQLWSACQELAQRFEHVGPVTCHLFLSPQYSLSFAMHTDPDDVVIYMVSGSKVFESPEGQITLSAGDVLLIPRGTPHRANNIDSSVMLSFGLEQFTDAKL